MNFAGVLLADVTLDTTGETWVTIYGPGGFAEIAPVGIDSGDLAHAKLSISVSVPALNMCMVPRMLRAMRP